MSKSFKLIHGVKLNIGKKSVSTTIGKRGLSTNIGSNGTFINIGILSTGIRYRGETLQEMQKGNSYNKHH